MRDIPAFPQDVSNTDCSGVLHSGDFLDGTGMTLRDYFAAKAMQSLLTGVWYNDERPVSEVKRGLALDAYEIADEMLKAREL